MITAEGYVFRQVDDGPIIVTFVSTSSDIDQWAKVPTKMSRKPIGFQKAEAPNHSRDIKIFLNTNLNRTLAQHQYY